MRLEFCGVFQDLGKHCSSGIDSMFVPTTGTGNFEKSVWIERCLAELLTRSAQNCDIPAAISADLRNHLRRVN